MSAIYIAGFGCRHGCSENSLRALLESSLQEYALERAQLSGLASIDSRRAEPGLIALAATLGLPLSFFTAAQLAAFEHRLSQRSEAVLAATGVAGVAEAAALAQAEILIAEAHTEIANARAELIIEKRKNADATFALARIILRQQAISPQVFR